MSLIRAERSFRADEEHLDARCPATYVWQYVSHKDDLRALYEKAKREQWNGAEALDWSISVDPESEILPDANNPIFGSPIWHRMTPAEQRRFRRESYGWMLSQFLHGEQGALLTAAQIVDTVPWIDAKFYASTQVVDEARHVEVYERYLREKVETTYPVNANLKSLLDQVLTDPRWDMKYLGMQILIEGLALASFRMIHDFTGEPLIKQLIHNVMRDEARHVAFGVLSLREFYERELNERERREREEFTYEASRLMRDRLVGEEVYARLGLPVDECRELTLQSSVMREFRKFLFARVVPNVKRLGLLTPWLKERFAELDILRFEDFPADA
ncbi:MAG TPA: ferritin-like domain-containing protein [Polyangia bacterium]|nr:ferritin-like domain-containing protein [Polyangia bacterium]